MSTKTRDDRLDTLSDLFIAEASRPAHLTPVEPDQLPPFARVLLVTDGTVTHMLRAHYREPVEVFVEAHEFVTAKVPNRWLDVSEGDEVLVRDVSLKGANSGRLFARARSHIALDRLSVEMRDDITSMRRSIGNVLLANFSENRRELLWHGLVKAAAADVADPGQPEAGPLALERSYRVIAGGHPLMIITETFAPLILT